MCMYFLLYCYACYHCLQACASDDGAVVVVLDTRKDERVLQQRLAREALNRIQKLRKKVRCL
jgi:hypothetical protein